MQDGGFSTLGSIIKQKVFHFENVEAMKNCLTLIPGDVVQTLGYYEKNDGGEGLYEIVNDSSLEDDGGSVHELDNGLKAKLIIEKDTINVKQFGAKGDGITDDTGSIQSFFNFKSSRYNIIDGEYLVSEDISVINNNIHIFFENASIVRKPNDLTLYYILNIYNVHDVVIENAHIIGDKELHTGTEGECGHCLNITDSYNIEVKNSILENAWGDGIYIGLEYYKTPLNVVKNINISNCKILNCSRNGISVCSGKDIVIDSCFISNVQRVYPKSGIDIEAEHENINNTYIKNLRINNIITNLCDSGIVFNSNIGIDCKISNCKSIEDTYGMVFYRLLQNSYVDIINNYIKNVVFNGVQIKDIDNTSHLNIDKLDIIDCSGSNHDIYTNSAILLDNTAKDINNININNVNIQSISNFGSSFYINNVDGYKVYNLNINNLISPFPVILKGIDTNTCNINIEKKSISNYYQETTGHNNQFINRYITTKCASFETYRKLLKDLPNGDYIFELYNLNSYSYFVDLTSFEEVYDNGSLLTNKKLYCNSNSGTLKVFLYNNIAYIKQKVGTWIAKQ